MSFNTVIDLNLSPSISRILDSSDDPESWDDWNLDDAGNTNKTSNTLISISRNKSSDDCINSRGVVNDQPSSESSSCHNDCDSFMPCDNHVEVNNENPNTRNLSSDQSIEPNVETLENTACTMTIIPDSNQQDYSDCEDENTSETIGSFNFPSPRRFHNHEPFEPSHQLSSRNYFSPEPNRQNVSGEASDEKQQQLGVSTENQEEWDRDLFSKKESTSRSRATIDTEKFSHGIKRHLGLNEHDQAIAGEWNSRDNKWRAGQESKAQSDYTPSKRSRRMNHSLDVIYNNHNESYRADRSSYQVKERYRKNTGFGYSNPAGSNLGGGRSGSVRGYSDNTATSTSTSNNNTDNNNTNNNRDFRSDPRWFNSSFSSFGLGLAGNYFPNLQSSFMPLYNQYNQNSFPSYPQYVTKEIESLSQSSYPERPDLPYSPDFSEWTNKLLIQFSASEIELLSQFNYWERCQHLKAQQSLREALVNRDELYSQLKVSEARVRQLEKSQTRLYQRLSKAKRKYLEP